MSLQAGARLGPYEIVAPLGAGGMGEVYRARDTRLDRTVAIKVLPPQLAADPQLRERFEREARAISSLQHPHICALFDVGRDCDHEFLVLEFLEGETLADRLARTGAMPVADALKIGIEICDALDRAHRSGTVHRDLKPANVMLVRGGGASARPTAKLLDFGLAKAAAPVITTSSLSMAATTPPNVTAQGTILGTFQYMAPEQIEGLDADARTDIFAFGAVCFEMLTGRTAFEGKTRASLLGAILKDEPPRVSQLQPLAPPALDRVVSTCLAKDPDDRYQSARDLLRDLKWVASGAAESRTAPAAPARHITRTGWAIVGGLSIAMLATAFVVRQLRPAPAADPIQFTIESPADTTFSTPPGGGTGSTSQIAISPDGRTVAFVAHDQGGYRLWVRSLGGLDARPLAGTDDATFPFWSPDNRYLAFFAGGKLRKVAVSGGPPVILCDALAGRGGTWNRDNVIVFSPSNSDPLHRVSGGGGTPQPVTTFDKTYGESSHRFPWFLPDGRHFLFTGVIGTCCPPAKPGRIRVAALDSTDLTTLATADSAAQYAAGHLLFQRDGTLLATPFDAASQRVSGDAFPIAQEVGYEGIRYASFSASSTGTLVYARGSSRAMARLTWHDRNGRVLGTVGDPARYFSIALSPDGRRVAAALGSDTTRDIWILDVASGTPTRFTFGAGAVNAPLWTRDGGAIVYSANRDGVPGMYSKRVTGTTPEELLLASQNGSSAALAPNSWSSDDRYLVFSRSQGTSGSIDIWALPLSGDRKPFGVIETPATESNGVLSPDGKWIAYQASQGAQVEIYVQPFPPTGGKFQVSNAGGFNPTWRDDGKELFFVSLDGRMMAAAVATDGPFHVAAPTALFSVPTLVSQSAGRSYAVTKDGRFLVNVVQQQTAVLPLTVVVNWLSTVQR